MPIPEMTGRKIELLCLALVLLAGIFLRLPPSLFSSNTAPLRSIAFLHPISKWHQLTLVGVDEALYRDYIDEVRNEGGLTHYPDVLLHYIEEQVKLPGSILPPVRFLYIFNRWLRIGTVTREMAIATAVGPLFGIVVLIFLAGGWDVLYGTYRLLIVKNIQLPYAIKTGDGPWYRYLLDLLLVSPIILI